MTIDAIEVAALELPEADRERLAHRLIASLSLWDDWPDDDADLEGAAPREATTPCAEPDVGSLLGGDGLDPESGAGAETLSIDAWMSSFDSEPGLPR